MSSHFLKMNQAQKPSHDEQDEQLPVPLDKLGSPPLPFLYLALQHFSGSSRWA